MTASLEGAVPPHEPADDAVALVSKIGLSAIPVVGSMAVETLAHALETRQAQRQHDFNVTIARALSSALERLDGTLTLDDVVNSDGFLAAVTRAQRVAAETASASKRRRLAAAVASAVVPSDYKLAELEAYAQLTEQYDDLRVWLLAFYCNPEGWLHARGLASAADSLIRGGQMDEPLRAALGIEPRRTAAVVDALADLQRDSMLGAFQLDTMRGERGQFNAQTTGRGRRFLTFVGETEAIDAVPPATL